MNKKLRAKCKTDEEYYWKYEPEKLDNSKWYWDDNEEGNHNPYRYQVGSLAPDRRAKGVTCSYV